MKAYRGALIGCGYISYQQLAAWQKVDGAEIVAVCDLDEKKARALADEFDIEAVYRDYQKMLDEVEVDFVDIATRPATHLELVAQAAERGLHVLCQKPIADDLETAQRMVEVCREAGITLMINENCRHQAWFRKLKKLLDEGALGAPYYARFETRSRATLPHVKFKNQPYFRTMPRLLIFEMGVHFLDAARYLFGEASHVRATTKQLSPDIAGEDFALIDVNFSELNCTIDMNWAGVSVPQRTLSWGPVRVEGTLATAVLGWDGLLHLYTDEGTQTFTFPVDTVDRSFASTQQHFVDCLQDGREPETSGAETLKTMALVFGAYASAEQGVSVDSANLLTTSREASHA